MNNKLYVSWDEVESYIDELYKELYERKFSPSGVYGIPRGGMVLATLISYNFNIPLLMAPTKNCIIVDDIADSGRTLLHFTNNDTQFNHYFITTMYHHERSLVRPDFYISEKNDKWVCFPWERGEE